MLSGPGSELRLSALTLSLGKNPGPEKKSLESKLRKITIFVKIA